MDLNLIFLLTSKKMLDKNEYNDIDLSLMTEFILNLDSISITTYYNTQTFTNTENDLIFFINVLSDVLKANEKREHYEYCHRLLLKKKAIIHTFKIKEYGTI